MAEKEKEDETFFSKLKICSVIKPKGSIILQVLEIANKYILILPDKGEIEIYEIKFPYWTNYSFQILNILILIYSIY